MQKEIFSCQKCHRFSTHAASARHPWTFRPLYENRGNGRKVFAHELNFDEAHTAVWAPVEKKFVVVERWEGSGSPRYVGEFRTREEATRACQKEGRRWWKREVLPLEEYLRLSRPEAFQVS